MVGFCHVLLRQGATEDRQTEDLTKDFIMNRSEMIRKEILLQVYASRPLGLSAERIERDARKEGYDYTRTEIARELQFLADEDLVILMDEKGTTLQLFRIAPSGVRQYEQKYSA